PMLFHGAEAPNVDAARDTITPERQSAIDKAISDMHAEADESARQRELDTIANALGGHRTPVKTIRGSEPKPEVLEAINKDTGQQNTVAPQEVLEELRQKAGLPTKPDSEPTSAPPQEEGEIL